MHIISPLDKARLLQGGEVDAEIIGGEGIFKFECLGEFEVIFKTASTYEPGKQECVINL